MAFPVRLRHRPTSTLHAVAAAAVLCLGATPVWAQARAQLPPEEQEPDASAAVAAPPPAVAAPPPAVAAPPPAVAAQAAPPPTGLPAPAGEPEAQKDGARPGTAEREDIREVDANVDHVILLPTAETHPKGRMYFSAYEIIFWQLGYAISDRVQATLTTWPVIMEHQPFFVDGSVKANFYRSDTARLAVAAGVTFVANSVNEDIRTLSVGHLALLGQVCLTPGCWTSAVAGLGGWVPLGQGVGTVVAGGIGLTSKLSKYVGLLVEVDSGAHYQDELYMAEGYLFNYGVRFAGSNFGFDLTMLKPVGFDDAELAMGLPWLAFTYRSDPQAK